MTIFHTEEAANSGAGVRWNCWHIDIGAKWAVFHYIYLVIFSAAAVLLFPLILIYFASAFER